MGTNNVDFLGEKTWIWKLSYALNWKGSGVINMFDFNLIKKAMLTCCINKFISTLQFISMVKNRVQIYDWEMGGQQNLRDVV